MVMVRRAVGSRDLKTRLGSWLRLVEGGETILVTDRGRAVAELRPVPQDQKEPGALLAELVLRGDLVAPTRSGGPLPPPLGPDLKLAEALAADREDRF